MVSELKLSRRGRGRLIGLFVLKIIGVVAIAFCTKWRLDLCGSSSNNECGAGSRSLET